MVDRRKKKLLFLHHSSAHGGAGISMLNAINALKNYYNVVLAYPVGWSGADNDDIIDIQKVPYRFQPTLFPCYSGGANLFSLSTLRFLCRKKEFEKEITGIISQIEPDLVVVNSITLAYLARSVKISNLKSVCFVRETITHNSVLLKKIYLGWLKHFDMVFFISNYDQICFSNLDTPSEVLKNTCSNVTSLSVNSKICSVSHEPQPLKILYVGGSSRIKGYYFLLKVCKKLFDQEKKSFKPKYQVTICGDINKVTTSVRGRIVGYVRFILTKFIFKDFQKAVKLEWLIITGELDTVTQQYRATDLVFLPIQKQHQQRPIFEAGAEAKPVVVPDFECLYESVDDYASGFFYDHNDPNSAIECFGRFVADRNLSNQMGLIAKQKAEKDHSVSLYSEKLLFHINKMTEK